MEDFVDLERDDVDLSNGLFFDARKKPSQPASKPLQQPKQAPSLGLNSVTPLTGQGGLFGDSRQGMSKGASYGKKIGFNDDADDFDDDFDTDRKVTDRQANESK